MSKAIRLLTIQIELLSELGKHTARIEHAAHWMCDNPLAIGKSTELFAVLFPLWHNSTAYGIHILDLED